MQTINDIVCDVLEIEDHGAGLNSARSRSLPRFSVLIDQAEFVGMINLRDVHDVVAETAER